LNILFSLDQAETVIQIIIGSKSNPKRANPSRFLYNVYSLILFLKSFLKFQRGHGGIVSIYRGN